MLLLGASVGAMNSVPVVCGDDAPSNGGGALIGDSGPIGTGVTTAGAGVCPDGGGGGAVVGDDGAVDGGGLAPHVVLGEIGHD